MIRSIRTVTGALLVLQLLGCTSSQEALRERRSVIRGERLPDRAALAIYRSTETIRGMRWGMTMAEVVAARGQPALLGDDVMLYDELLEGRVMRSRFVFFDGQLAELQTRWDDAAQTMPKLRAELAALHGAPTDTYDQREALADAAELPTRDEAEAILAGELALTVLSPGHPLPTGAARAFDGAGARERAIAQARRNPAYLATWTTPDTLIRLLSPNGTTTQVTWRSVRFDPLLTRREGETRSPTAALGAP